MTNLFLSAAMVLAVALGGCSNNEKITATALPAPVVSIDSVPNYLKGSTTIKVTYDNQVVDQKYIVSVNFLYSADGVNFIPVADVDPAANSYEWTIPRIDSATAKVKVIAKDNRGFSNEKVSNTFNILSTPPLITVTTNNAVVSNTPSVTFAGTCKAGAPITFFPGLTAQVSDAMKSHYAKLSAPSCTDQGTWSFVVSETVLNDIFSYTLQQSDVVGNSSQVSFTWTRNCLTTEYANGEVCTPQICAAGTSNTDKAGCSNAGTRSRTCSINGSAWSDFGACSCSTGYTGANCSNCSAGYYLNGTSCVPQVCTPNMVNSDNIACSTHGTRTETCSASGSGYGAWTSCACAAGYSGTSCSSCAAGYYNNNGSCVPQVCKPGSITTDNVACSLHGSRSETCSTDGSSLGTFGSCACTAGYSGANCSSCAAGYYNNNGSCVPQVCKPGSITTDNVACSLHGSRSETCTTDGSSLGSFGSCACTAGYTGATCTSCAAGYYDNNGSCVPQACKPGSITTDNVACSLHGTRSETCTTDGSSLGTFGACACTAGYTGANCTSCATGYFNNNGSCVPQVCKPGSITTDNVACSLHGTRSETCTTDGSSLGSFGSCACTAGYTGATCTSCATGFYNKNGSCVPDVCTPGSVTSDNTGCSLHGTRTETCAADGSSLGTFGSCACAAGYSGSTCTSCATGYYKNAGGSCVSEVCSPSAVNSDATGCSNHGNRSQSCSTNGSTWNAFGACTCSAGYSGADCSSCSTGYFKNGNSCVPDVCTPGSVQADATGCSNDGNRSRTCSADGSAWGSYGSCACAAGYTGATCSSCTTGYFKSGNSCIANVCTPGSAQTDSTGCSNDGTRSRTCSVDGSAWGSYGSCACAAGYTGATCSSCTTGYFKSGNSCIANVCTPGAAQTDSTGCSNDGTRSRSCAVDGSAWGSYGSCACAAGYTGATCSSCTTGYFKSGNSCVADVCSPGTIQKDSVGCGNDGTRSRTCSTDGSAWGSYTSCACAAGYTGATCSSCATGFFKSGNSCVADVCTPNSAQSDTTGCSNQGSRSRSCSTDGSAWGSYGSCACSAGYSGADCSTCSTGYFKSGNSCVADVCSPSTVQKDSAGCSNDGTRSRTCSTTGSAWGTYSACTCSTGYTGSTCSSCSTGFYFNGTACVADACTPSATQTDTIGCSAEGSRTRACATNGSAWGSYSACACKTGYNGSDCSSCAAGYYFNSSGGCSAQTCTPNAADTDATGCSAHGMRSRSCAANGSSWGTYGSCSCNVGWAGASCNACDSAHGYTMVGNSCVQQVTINYSMTEMAAQYYTDTVSVDANLSLSGNQGHGITPATGNTASTKLVVNAGEVMTASCYGGAAWGYPWPTGRSPSETMTIKDQNGTVVYNQTNTNQANKLTSTFTAAAGNIYTVDCHSARAATCSCGSGFSITSDQNGCIRTTTTATLKAPNRQAIIQGDTSNRYYTMPGIMADTKGSTLTPFAIQTADSGITGIKGSNGTSFPFTKYSANSFWLNRVTGASRISIKSNSDSDNQWLTKTYCVEVGTEADYAFHIGGDNLWQIKIDGNAFAQCTSGDGSDVYCYRGPEFLTSHLYAAKHTVELKYQNLGSQGAVWFEIFKNSLADLQSATSTASLNVISSTASLQTGATWDYTGDACPAGYALDACSSTANNQCTKQEHTDCN